MREKKVIFSMWDLKPFSNYILCSQKKKLFFQCGIWSFLVYTLCSQEKNYIFSMWDKKILKYSFKLYYL